MGCGGVLFHYNVKQKNDFIVDFDYKDLSTESYPTFDIAAYRYRRYCEGEIMDVCSRMDVTQSEGDVPDSNQSEQGTALC